MKYPSFFRLSSGSGSSRYRLVAFDNALIDAGISNYNLVRVSSILPQNSEEEKTIDLREGSLLSTAYATISSNTPGTMLATAVTVGIPKDPNKIGIIMEYEAEGIGSKTAAEIAGKMVEESMRNHCIPLKCIHYSSAEGIVQEDYLCLISAIAMW